MILVRTAVGAARAMASDLAELSGNPGTLHLFQSLLFFAIIHMICDLQIVQNQFKKLFPQKDEVSLKRNCHLLTARVVGAVHNTIQIPLAVYVLLDPGMTGGNILTNRSTTGHLVMVVSGGYFAMDTFLVIKNGEPWLYIVHGAAAFFGAAWSVLNGWQQYYGAVFAVYELSTYFVHLRWLLYKMGLEESSLYFWNGVVGMATFFLVRNVFGGIMGVKHIMLVVQELTGQSPIPAPMLVAFGLLNMTLNGLNAWWFYKMLQMAARAVKGERLSDVTKGKEE